MKQPSASLGALPAPAAIALSSNNLCIPGEPLLSQLNTKTIPTSNTTWATTQKSTNCGVTPPPAQFSLSVTASNGSVSCNGSTCQTSYLTNTALTLVATPSSGYNFTGWSGACSGTATTCQITLDAAKNVTANFSIISGGGTTTGTGGTTTTGGIGSTTGNSGIWPSCAEHARYSIEDYTLTVPALEVPLLSFLGDALGESIYYETVLKQVNGTNDRFVLQKITELVKVEADNAICAKFDLDQGIATLPIVDVKLPIPSPMDEENYGFNTERYTVTLKWMPILGAEVFVVQSINKIAK